MAWLLYGLHVNISHFEQTIYLPVFFPKVVAYDVVPSENQKDSLVYMSNYRPVLWMRWFVLFYFFQGCFKEKVIILHMRDIWLQFL